MADMTDAAKADQLSARRARLLPVLALLVVAQQAAYLTDEPGGGPASGRFHVAAWLVMSIVALAALTTGGGWIYSREVRRLANDEATRAHRDRAFRAGFLASMGACIGLYFLSIFAPLGGRGAIHVVMTTGIVVTLLWFAFLERRAHRGG